MSSARPRALAAVSYVIIAYAAFLTAVAWAVTFLADVQLPRGIDHGVRHTAACTVGVDGALLLLFAVQHTVMARAGFKRWLARWVPRPVERSTYVLAASLVLLLLFWQWQPADRVIWDVHNAAADAMWVVFALGWLIAISSTFMIDHLEFLGLRAAYRNARGSPAATAQFCERWLYAWVRHPLMLGLMLAFWATPRMTTGHLLFAAASTGYIAVGVWFEERDLERDFDTVYRDYARRVPAYFPMRRPNRARRHEAVLAPTDRGSCPW